MGRMINDIPFSDMSHNSRVLKLHNRMKDAQTRFSETQKSKITRTGEVVKSRYTDNFVFSRIREPLVKNESKIEHQPEPIKIVSKPVVPITEPIKIKIKEPLKTQHQVPNAIPALGKLKVKPQKKIEPSEQIKLFNKYLLSFLELPPFYNRQVVVSFPYPSILKIEKMLNYQNPVKIGLSINSLHNEALIKSFDILFEYLSKFRHIKKEHIRIMYVKDSSRLRLYLYVWSTINHHYEYVKELDLFTEKNYNILKMVV